MAYPDNPVKRLNARAQATRDQEVDRLKNLLQTTAGINPLRAMTGMCQDIIKANSKEGIPPQLNPFDFTIGSVESRSFGRTRDDEPDPDEAEFTDLAQQMGMIEYTPE